MLELSRYRNILLVSLLVFSAVAGCASQKRVSREPVSQEPVSPQLLTRSDLEILWQNQLPIEESESLQRLFVLGNRIYALTSRNYMIALNREKGNVIFSKPIGRAGFPVIGLGLYENKLFSIIGNKLIEFNPESGTQLDVKHLAFSANLAAVRNDSHFYIAAADRRIHALRSEDKIQVFEVAADNNSAVTSVIADKEFVIFSTNAGNCVSILPDGPVRRWQFDAADGIVGPIVKDENSLYIASKDTNVYKLDALNGRFVWKYQTGAVLEKGPQVASEAVYQSLADRGLAAIDKKSGEFMWQLAEGAGLLAESRGKAYVITNTGELVVMDNKKGKRLHSISLAQVSKYAANVTDSKVYVADGGGRITCLKPLE